MKKNVLITGGTGFIGQSLTKALVKEKFKAAILSRQKINPNNANTRYIRADLLDAKNLAKKINGYDVVVHLGGVIMINYSVEHPAEIIGQNTLMLTNVLEAIRENGSKTLVVFASTDRVYGKTEQKIVDENEPVFPLEPYTASKIICEQLLKLYNHLYGIPYIILRLDSVYGPGQNRSMFISDVINKMIAGNKISVGDLSIVKNFVYVDDVAKAIISAIKANESARNTIYNVGGKSYSMKEIFDMLKKIIELKLEKNITVTKDISLFRKSGTEVRPFKLGTSKAGKKLGWQAEVPLNEGLNNTIDWFLENNHVKK